MQIKELSEFQWKQTKDGLIDFIAGTVGGVANVYTVKMQAFPHFYNNWISCFVKTIRLDGIRGLYAGLVPALAANIAENAVLFTAYGYCQKIVVLGLKRDNVNSLSPVENALSGSLASIFAAAVLCPTELVKCQLQAFRETNNKIPYSITNVCRKIYYKNGLFSFYVGMTPTLMREIPGCFFFFGAYESCRNFFTLSHNSKDNIGYFKTAISGAVGGITSWIVIFPADVIKSRMQTGTNNRFHKIFIDIIKKEGFLGFYKGLLPTLIRTCISSASLFLAYETTKSNLHQLLA